MDLRVGLWRKLSAEELMLLNCGVGEDSWESLGLQGDPTSPFWTDQPWVFSGRNDAKAETPVFWPPHAKSWLIGKDSDAGRAWGQEEKGTTEDEMAGWHHWLDGHESEWIPGDGNGQGGLACCYSWGRKESDTTERLNWTGLNRENTHPMCILEIHLEIVTDEGQNWGCEFHSNCYDSFRTVPILGTVRGQQIQRPLRVRVERF